MKNKIKIVGSSVLALSLTTNPLALATETTQPANTENSVEAQPTQPEYKYTATYIYENFDLLPEIIKSTLPEKFESNSGFGWFFSPARVRPIVDKENKKYWELGRWARSGTNDHRIYTASWTSTDMVEVSFNVIEPQDLPESLRNKTFDSFLTVPNAKVVLPEVLEEKVGNTIWTLTFPETVAGNEDSTVNGTWSSRELTYEGSVTFVTNHGDQVVKFANQDEAINKTDEDGNKANENDSGGGFSKAYFLGWSNIRNYNGTQKNAKVFYGHEPISNAFPNGFKGGEKLYAFYLSTSSVIGLGDRLSGKVEINKYVDSSNTMNNKFEIKDEDKINNQIDYFVPNNILDKNVVNAGSSFKLNPFITAVVRKNNYYAPGTAEYYGADDNAVMADKESNFKEHIADIKDKYTYVDLHIKLDDRLEVGSNLNFDLKSYSFRPFAVLKSDYSGIYEGANITHEDNSPISHISVDIQGSREFILRTRTKHDYKIPNATLEEASTDMQLISRDENNAKISKEEILKIARDEANPLSIGGHIQGGAKLYSTRVPILGEVGGPTDIPKQAAKNLLLGFKPAFVNFNLNAPFKAETEQNLGKSRVALNGNIDNDIFDRSDKPVYSSDEASNKIGEAMPTNPEIENYKFEGYNTMADGSGKVFTGTTNVELSMLTNGEMTAYAQWSFQVSFNKNSANLNDKIEQNLGAVDVKYNENLENGILRNGIIPTPTLEGYKFKEWNTKADGTGEKINIKKAVTESITYYAVWEKIEKPDFPVVPNPIVPNVPTPEPIPDITQKENSKETSKLKTKEKTKKLSKTGQQTTNYSLGILSMLILVLVAFRKKIK